MGRKRRIYADAAAATPLSLGVQKELLRLQALYGNPGGLHKEAVAAKKELERARARVAKVVGAHPDEIFFTSGGTESNNLAISGTLRPLLHERGELNAITTAIEHLSVLEPLNALEREGLYTAFLPVDEKGILDTAIVRDALNEETALISVQLVNSEIGTIQDIREIAKEIRHEKRRRNRDSGANASTSLKESKVSAPTPSSLPLYFHCDASQAPLWLPINVEKLGVDMLTLDAQKMMGPKGVGVLYVRRGTEIEPLLWGGGQEHGLRSGTENVVMAGAIAEALEEAQAEVEQRVHSVAHARDTLFADIKQYIPDVELNGVDGTGRVANNLNISIPGLDAQMAVIALDAEGVAVSTRSACSGSDEEPSYVITALQKNTAQAKSSIRISLLPEATLDDARMIARALKIVAERYQNVV